MSATESHDRLRAAQSSADSAFNALRVSVGAWYPNMAFSAGVGRERFEKPGPSNTNMYARQMTVRATQLLWDFGATNADIERARLTSIRADVSVERTRQELLLEGLGAYATLLKSQMVLKYARQSEENIRRQTGLEEVRLREGYGFSTDVLQAKSQLAGAQARRVASEEAVQVALNRFQAFFGHVDINGTALQALALPEPALPRRLEEALTRAQESNLRLQELTLTSAAARENVTATQGRSFYPRIEGVLERTVKDDYQGTAGRQNESVAKVQLTLPFNLGFTALNSVKQARADAAAADASLADQERQVLEGVRNSWSRLQSARQQAELLRDQASLAKGFLEVARSERELGTRSLIDLLTGETTLINAQSDAAAAETDVALAGYQLLAAIGHLSYTDVRTRPVGQAGKDKPKPAARAPKAPAKANPAPAPAPAAPAPSQAPSQAPQ
ncbi:adhesin transport system outer membrane protein [Azospirillum fermentarium]|uniref:TolC family protein n=1 Tax=Azospirillum fermentarium TaxID=1233114 RepID=UPI00222804BC|nr:TolC family protein [Azospirillum fermentarium]MCW2249436.1 adhesin transport system outer membrane protein [Azospirillum fermentarium]